MSHPVPHQGSFSGGVLHILHDYNCATVAGTRATDTLTDCILFPATAACFELALQQQLRWSVHSQTGLRHALQTSACSRTAVLESDGTVSL